MKEQEKSNVTDIADARKRHIPFSRAMRKKVSRMNTVANTLESVSKGAQAQAQAAQVDLQDYLLYCRDELGAPEEHYEIKRIDVGFALKKKEDLDGIH